MEMKEKTTGGVLFWTPAPICGSSCSSVISEEVWEDDGSMERGDDFASQMDENGIIGLEEAFEEARMAQEAACSHEPPSPGYDDASGGETDTEAGLEPRTRQQEEEEEEEGEEDGAVGGSSRCRSDHRIESESLSLGPSTPEASSHLRPREASPSPPTSPVPPHLLHFTPEEMASAEGINSEVFPEMIFTESLTESPSSVTSHRASRPSPGRRQRSSASRGGSSESSAGGSRRSSRCSSPGKSALSWRGSPPSVGKARQGSSDASCSRTLFFGASRAVSCPAVTEDTRKAHLSGQMPNFSQVEPRVRFPKGVYKPPKSKHSPQRECPEPALVFKSPADIVKEVLLNSSDGTSSLSDSAAAVPLCAANAIMPEDFKSQQHAIALIEQLQEEHNRLLIKYAAAENTIDRLRLGAKVNLYTDPPQPGVSEQSAQGTAMSSVTTLDFPQAQQAELASASAPPHTDDDSSHQGSLSECSPTSTSLSLSFSSSLSSEPLVGPQHVELLHSQTNKFVQQIQSFEDILRRKKLRPSQQKRGLSKLFRGLDSLERSYLMARDQHKLQEQQQQQQQQQQQPQQQGDTITRFDPDRELEGLIFQCGQQLEELRERVEQPPQEPTTSEATPSLPVPNQERTTISSPWSAIELPSSSSPRFPRDLTSASSPQTVSELPCSSSPCPAGVPPPSPSPRPLQEIPPSSSPRPLQEIPPSSSPRPLGERNGSSSPLHACELPHSSFTRPVDEIPHSSSPRPLHEVPPSSSPRRAHEPPHSSSPRPLHEVPPSSSPRRAHEPPHSSSPRPLHEVPPSSSPRRSHEPPPSSSPRRAHEPPPSSSPRPLHEIPPSSSPRPLHEPPPTSSPRPHHEVPPSSSPRPLHELPLSSSPRPLHEIPPSSSPRRAHEPPPSSSPRHTREPPASSSPLPAHEPPPSSSPWPDCKLPRSSSPLSPHGLPPSSPALSPVTTQGGNAPTHSQANQTESSRVQKKKPKTSTQRHCLPRGLPVLLLVGHGGVADVDARSSSDKYGNEETDSDSIMKLVEVETANAKLAWVREELSTQSDDHQSLAEFSGVLDYELKERAALALTDLELGQESFESRGNGDAAARRGPPHRSPSVRSSLTASDRRDAPGSRKRGSRSNVVSAAVSTHSSSRRSEPEKSPGSSLKGSVVSERRSKLQAVHRRVLPQDGIFSPETDSGFLGSDSIRLNRVALPLPSHQRALRSIASREVKHQASPASVLSPVSSRSSRRTSAEPGGAPRLRTSRPGRSREVEERGSISRSTRRWGSHAPHYTTDSESSESGLKSDAQSLSEYEQSDQYAESFSTPCSPGLSSTPTSQYLHGDGPSKALSSSQVATSQDAMRSLQAEVNRLKEKLEVSLRSRSLARSGTASSSPQGRSRRQTRDMSGERRRTRDEVSPRRTSRESSAYSHRHQCNTSTVSESQPPAPQLQVSRQTQTSVPPDPPPPETASRHSSTVCSRKTHSRPDQSVCAEDVDGARSQAAPPPPPLCSPSSPPRRGQQSQEEAAAAAAHICHVPSPSACSCKERKSSPAGPASGMREASHSCCSAASSSPSSFSPPPCSSHMCHCPQCGRSPDCHMSPPRRTSCRAASLERTRHCLAVTSPLLPCMPVCPESVLVHSQPVIVSPMKSGGSSSSGGRKPTRVKKRAMSADGRRPAGTSVSMHSDLDKAVRAAMIMKHTTKHMVRALAAGLHYQELLSQFTSH